MKGKKSGILKKIIIVVVIIIIAGAIFSSVSDDKPKKVGEVGDSGASGDNSSDSGKTSEFKVGDIVETKVLRITFLSAGEYKSTNEFIQPNAGKIFYRLEYEFENIGSEDEYISSMVGFECYADGYACDQSFAGDDDLSATLSPDKKVKGSIYFEVPADSKEIVVEYKDNVFLDEKVVFRAK